MDLRIKNTPFTLKVIGWLQLIGGVFGWGIIASMLMKTGEITGPVLLIFFIGFGVFALSMYAGKSLIVDENKIYGIQLSIINYSFQIFQFYLLGYGLVYSSGAEFAVGFESLAISFDVALLSKFEMALNSGDEFLFQINFFAVLIMVILVDILKEIKNKELALNENEPEEKLIYD